MKGKSTNKILMTMIVILCVVTVLMVVMLSILMLKQNRSSKGKNTEKASVSETTAVEDENEFKAIAYTKADEFTQIVGDYYKYDKDYEMWCTTIYKKSEGSDEFEEIAKLYNCSTPYTDGKTIYYLENLKTEDDLYNTYLKKCSMSGGDVETVGQLAKDVINSSFETYYNGRFYMSTMGKTEDIEDIYIVNKEVGRCRLLIKNFNAGIYNEGKHSYKNYIIGTDFLYTSPGIKKYLILNLDTGETKTLTENCARIYVEGEWIYYAEGDLITPEGGITSDKKVNLKIKKCKFDMSGQETLKNLKVNEVCGVTSITSNKIEYSEYIGDSENPEEKSAEY
jgi:hypothetical protein